MTVAKTGPMTPRRAVSARRAVFGALLAGLVGLGVAAVPAAAVGVGVHVPVVHGGALRSYRLFVPASLPAGRTVPLVVVLHGLGASPTATANLTRFDDLAERYGFVAAYPEGLGKSWNAGTCCGSSVVSRVDDVGFLARVVSDVSLAVRVDRARVYAAGFSNGGMMAMRAACERPDLFAAVASVAGTLVAPCAADRPVSVLQVTGMRDVLVPYRGTSWSGTLRSPLSALPVAAGTWERTAACSGLPARTRTARVETRSYDRCAGGSAVRLVQVTGAGHVWPTAARDGYQASEEAWRFLSSHAAPWAYAGATPVLTTKVVAARSGASITGRLDGRFDVVIGRRLAVEVRRGTRWVAAGRVTTDVEGRFRFLAPAGGPVRVRYGGSPGLPSVATVA